MINYNFWLDWKNKTKIEKNAIAAVEKARALVVNSIPRKALVAIYIKGSFVRREMKQGSDVEMVPIVNENKYQSTVFRTNIPEISPVMVVPLSLWELKNNELFTKSDSIPDLRAKPDRFLSKLNECKLIYGKPLDPKDFPIRSDIEALEEQIKRVELWISAYGAGKVEFSIKEVFWLVELEQRVEGKEVEHSYQGIVKAVGKKSHIIHEAFKFRTGEYETEEQKRYLS